LAVASKSLPPNWEKLVECMICVHGIRKFIQCPATLPSTRAFLRRAPHDSLL
jgi:hypothetical protein